MKTKLYLLFFFVFPLFMSACRGDDPIPDPPVDGKRTVLVYMAADNSINPLASFTDGDLEELKAGMASIDNTSDMHLLVYIDTGFPRLIEIENKGGTVVETIVKEYEDRNSCGVAETQEVFNDVFGNSLYKAESYGLIYWSHGEGWIPTPLPSTRWIGNDKTGGGHYMNIEDLKLVLQNAPHFDFIMFDACFMQSVEVAYELRDCCDYYIGFPAENPGPATALAQQAGLKLGEMGGIWVDEHLETSEKDIYAVGDAIEYPHPLTGKPWLNYLANPANRQGRIVADNMVFGNTVSYEGAIGTSIAKVFDMTVASTGLAAKRLKQWGMEYQSSVTHSASHAGYYPDALPLTLKLTFHPKTGKLYGAQCIGYEGVDKRIDQIAGLIKRGGTVYDLMETEHTYAPPFSSAKDPIAIGGYVASNIISGAMPVISWRELVEEKDKVMLIDTRTPEEFSFGTIPGAVNIPLDEMREHLAEIPTDKPVVLFCAVGLRGYLSLRILMGCGYRNVRNLIGGYKTYSTATAPLPSPSAPAGGGSSSSSVEAATDDVPADASVSKKETLKINACGLQCPGPIMQVKKAMDSIAVGERVEIVATDAGFARDASAWCDTTGNKLIEKHDEKGRYTVVIEKGAPACASVSNTPVAGGRGKTLILFSDDLDKALATFVLANGAAATGQKVTIFFTFWGLNVLKKVQKPSVQKDFFGKMFGMMLPSSSLKLKLSQMNMFGMGSRMMRFLMKRKGVDSLESLRSQALAQGVEFIACQMSMDMMGIQHEELLDEVTIGGVATYMERADKANVNLFI